MLLFFIVCYNTTYSVVRHIKNKSNVATCSVTLDVPLWHMTATVETLYLYERVR